MYGLFIICQGWANRHQYTVKALRDQIPAELMYPNSHWAADQAPVQLGTREDSTRMMHEPYLVSGLAQDAMLSVSFLDSQNANLNVIVRTNFGRHISVCCCEMLPGRISLHMYQLIS